MTTEPTPQEQIDALRKRVMELETRPLSTQNKAMRTALEYTLDYLAAVEADFGKQMRSQAPLESCKAKISAALAQAEGKS